MPGFSGRQRSDPRQQLSAESAETRRQRRKENGDALYRNSASVPDSLVRFADEIHREDRISRVEEIELGTKTQEALRLQTLYDNLEANLDREPTDEEWCAAAGKINMEAIKQAIDDGLEAKNRLVTANLRMVQSVVNTYIRNGLSGRYNAGDMMQDGIVALIRAAEKFEPDRGWKFSTYAMYWVRASVKRSQIHQSRTIPVPQRLFENHKRLMRTDLELVQVLGRKPTNAELGQAIGMSELQVERCLSAMNQKCVSLDQGISNALKPNNGDREGSTLVEIVEARALENDDYTYQQQTMLREALIETLNRHLSPGEVELLMLRFGLRSGEQLSIAELSRQVGLKPDKIRRTIGACLQRLRSIGVEEWLAFERELL
jgi:RNA polymerase sigma factor (sigma-70 family)